MDTQAPSASATPVGSVGAQGVYGHRRCLACLPPFAEHLADVPAPPSHPRPLPYIPENGLPWHNAPGPFPPRARRRPLPYIPVNGLPWQNAPGPFPPRARRRNRPQSSAQPASSPPSAAARVSGMPITRYYHREVLPYQSSSSGRIVPGARDRVPSDDWSTVATASSGSSRASTTDNSVSSNATGVGSDVCDVGAFGTLKEDEVGISDEEVSEGSTSDYQEPLSESAASTRSESEAGGHAGGAQFQSQGWSTEEPASGDNASNVTHEGNAAHIVQAQNAASGQEPVHPVGPRIVLQGPLAYSQAGLYIPPVQQTVQQPVQHSTPSAQNLVESVQQVVPVFQYHNPPPFQYQNSHHNQLPALNFNANFRPQFDTRFNPQVFQQPVQQTFQYSQPVPAWNAQASEFTPSPARRLNPLAAPFTSPQSPPTESRKHPDVSGANSETADPASSGVFSTGSGSDSDDEYRPDSHISGGDVTVLRGQRYVFRRRAEERQRPAADRARRESAFSAAAAAPDSHNGTGEEYATAAVTPSSENAVYFSVISSRADPEDEECQEAEPEWSWADEP